MFSAFSHFADSGPTVHVAPGTDFTIAGWPITNSILYFTRFSDIIKVNGELYQALS